jgi:hypothetical protein
MRRFGAFSTSIVVALVSLSPHVASAQTASCKDFRESILRMENQSPRPPGWLNLDTYLRLLYDSFCIKDPTPERPVTYWYRADGTSTGVPSSSANRPADGAYATTQRIGDYCLKQAGELVRNKLGQSVRAGMDPSICAVLFAGIEGKPSAVPAEPLPPLPVGLDGGPYAVGPHCLAALNEAGNDLVLGNERAAQRSTWLATMRQHCPDFLHALERRTGARADREPARFWQGYGELLASGFSPASQMSTGQVAADPGFQRMCREAEANMNICEQRQANMRSIGTEPMGTRGQAGAFNDCRILYGQVAGMCQTTTGRALQTAAAQARQPAAATQARQQPQPQAQPGQSQPAQPTKCQQLISGYVAAAQAGDGPKSVAAHNALKQAGGCGVLDKVPPLQQAAPAAGDDRFMTRGSTPHLDASAGACDRNPAACSAAVDQLRQGTSPQAVAALYSNAISIGLQVGAIAGQGMLMMQQPNVQSGGGGGGSNMNSIGPGPVRGTYGQGAPQQQPQGLPPNRSTITGTTR